MQYNKNVDLFGERTDNVRNITTLIGVFAPRIVDAAGPKKPAANFLPKLPLRW